MWYYNYSCNNTDYLCHHGVKGMKWGIRRTPDQRGRQKTIVEKTQTSYINKMRISGHESTPKKAPSNAIIDHVGRDGIIDVRSFYNQTGWKAKDIHTTDHGNPKHHGGGAHITEYAWNEDGSLKQKESRSLTISERKENDDIL